MLRADALAYLTKEYQELSAEAQFTTQQMTDCYNNAIDMSLRELGVDEVSLSFADIEAPNILSYFALLNFYALKRFARLLAVRVDVNIAASLQAMRSQAAKQVAALLDMAYTEVQAYGYGAPTFQLGRMELDFNEPSWGEF